MSKFFPYFVTVVTNQNIKYTTQRLVADGRKINGFKLRSAIEIAAAYQGF
jgi:hypothetical protein